jgi:23S rRNA G2069 N7-methylase RlmK/C1962 C5-methylase RlmI
MASQLNEQFPFECMVDDIAFEQVQVGDLTFKRSVPSYVQTTHEELDKSLVIEVTGHPANARRVLVLNCGEGFAGIAALQSGNCRVVFVDPTPESIVCTWRNIFLNAPQSMAKAQCFASVVPWDELNDDTLGTLWCVVLVPVCSQSHVV